MKKTLLLTFVLLLAVLFNIHAQTAPRIKVDLLKNTISINDVLFTSSSTIYDYEKLLGRAERVEQKRGEDFYFIYDSLGIALSILSDTDFVNEVSITYLNDGSFKLASEPYKGILKVNDKVVNDQTTLKEMGKLAKVELVEVMNGYFLTPKRSLNVLMYYPEDNKKQLKQYAFSFAVD